MKEAMSKLNLFAVLPLALFVQHSFSISVENIFNESDGDETAGKSLECLQKYFEFCFGEMSKAQFNLIHEPFLQRSQVEQLFMRQSNQNLYNPMFLTTFGAIEETQRENYLIFLSLEDVELMKNIAKPNVHIDSFLYVFYEQTNSSISMADIHSIFASSFEQNVVISMASRTPEGSFEWNAFRVVLHKCMNAKQYKMIKVGQCRSGSDFQTFPLRQINNASCPVQVFGRYHPPFTYYDPVRGLYDGIEYHLIRTISNHLQMPIKFNFINATMALRIYNKESSTKMLKGQKSNEYLRQVKF